MKKNKFSIIIPVYNVQEYLKECLDSVVNQTFQDYEVIVVDDGSNDNSGEIIKLYEKHSNLKIIKQKNQGLSAARNNGVEQANGEYIIFLDGDDYLNLNALEVINENLNNEDVLRFQLSIVDGSNIALKNEENVFKQLEGPNAFKKIVEYTYIDNAVLYCYKSSFYKQNNFKFKEGYYHEDFGMTPIILLQAKSVSAINKCLYNYRQRPNSITNKKDLKTTIKKCKDFYDLGLNNIKLISNMNVENKDIILSYIANSMIIKGKEISGQDRTNYYKKLKMNNIFELMLKNTVMRKIKYIFAKYSYNLYLKVMK